MRLRSVSISFVGSSERASAYVKEVLLKARKTNSVYSSFRSKAGESHASVGFIPFLMVVFEIRCVTMLSVRDSDKTISILNELR